MDKTMAMVRAGSARRRGPLVLRRAGAVTVGESAPRSERIHRHDLGRQGSPTLGSNPSASRALAAVASETSHAATSSALPAPAETTTVLLQEPQRGRRRPTRPV
jgi:hypothetical protein